jgi:uncharacterized LabA/DUF88 family protein
MFKAKTQRIQKLAEKYSQRIQELERVFDRRTNVYIDFANVKPWATKLGWHVDVKRLKQFLDSFDSINSIKLYQGTLTGDAESEQFVREARGCGYDLTTKPVKIMRLSIDVSSIPANSPDILNNFVRAPLLRTLRLETIEYLNSQLRDLNRRGRTYLEDRKCNFDVEIGRDMLVDYAAHSIENFVLWSGDSDFVDPLRQLIDDGMKVSIFATARRVAAEFGELVKRGLFIYDIQKMRNFICWKREMEPEAGG